MKLPWYWGFPAMTVAINNDNKRMISSLPVKQVAAVCLLIAAWLCVNVAVVHTAEANDGAPVTVVTADEQSIVETVPLTGTITSERDSALSARTSGLVAEVRVDAGHRVASGDTLIQLDTELAELALARARAAVSEAQAQLDEAIRLSDEASKLSASQNIPETQVRAAEAEVAIRRAALQHLEVEVREQRERLERHTVIAPFDAVISRKLTEVGEWVDTGTPVLELVETERLRLDIQAPQHLYTAIKTDMSVTIKPDAMPDHSFKGTVRAKVPVNDPTARTFLVRVTLDDAGDVLTPGMSAQGLFRIDSDERGLVLPRDAIVRLPDGTNNVWVVSKNGDGTASAAKRQVKLGKTMADEVIIKSGLSAGQQVVLRGNEVLSDGQQVKIINKQ